MALVENTLFGKEDKVETAVNRLKTFEPSEGYYLAFSGGKDSQCIYHLAKMAGVKFDAHYSVTSVDPPELLRFIRREYPDVIWERPLWSDGKPEHYYLDGKPKQITMVSLIVEAGTMPTRNLRYCCSKIKEIGGHGRLVVTGVRWGESAKRKALHGIADIRTESQKLHAQAAEDNPAYKQNQRGGIIFMDDNEPSRRMVEHCYAKRRTTINPIVDWTEDDVWEFLNDVAKVPHCELYDHGLTRIGCVGCPLQGQPGISQDLDRWPGFRKMYIYACNKMIEQKDEIRHALGKVTESGEQVLDAWLEWNN